MVGHNVNESGLRGSPYTGVGNGVRR
jgi:hypothetical protein